MRDQTSYTSRTVAWDFENKFHDLELQDTEIISVILATAHAYLNADSAGIAKHRLPRWPKWYLRGVLLVCLVDESALACATTPAVCRWRLVLYVGSVRPPLETSRKRRGKCKRGVKVLVNSGTAHPKRTNTKSV